MYLYWLNSEPYNWNELLSIFGINEKNVYLVNFVSEILEKAVLETNTPGLVWINLSTRRYGENEAVRKIFVTTGFQDNLQELELKMPNITSIIDTCDFDYERLFGIFKDKELEYIHRIEIDKVKTPL